MAQYPPQYMTKSTVFLLPTSASLDALSPRVMKRCVADISAVLEPSATSSATTGLARFLYSTALEACGTGR